MPSPVDKIELFCEEGVRQRVQLRYMAELAELAGLQRHFPEAEADTGPLLADPARRRAFDGLAARGGTAPGFAHIEWEWGELQEFDEEWSGRTLARFEMRFKERMMRAGVPSGHAAFVCGALDEMISNAQEHSSSELRSLATFEVTPSWWMFSVTDFGIGIPERLRENRLHRNLRDPDAISKALEHGVSTFAQEGRGMGFSSVFRALTERAAKLRIRSGRGLVEWEGLVNGTGEQQLLPKPLREGTHVRAAAKIR